MFFYVNGIVGQGINTGPKNSGLQKTLQQGEKNILRQNLADLKKILLALLHIRLGMLKQFVKMENVLRSV